jgi:hypothetical protein
MKSEQIVVTVQAGTPMFDLSLTKATTTNIARPI